MCLAYCPGEPTWKHGYSTEKCCTSTWTRHALKRSAQLLDSSKYVTGSMRLSAVGSVLVRLVLLGFLLGVEPQLPMLVLKAVWN